MNRLINELYELFKKPHELEKEICKNLEILISPLVLQQKIGKLPKSLDDKIELNNKINKNLEEQAKGSVLDARQTDSYIYDGNAIVVSEHGAYTGRTRFYSGRFDLYQRTYACTLHDNITQSYIFPLYWFVKLELSKKIMGGTRGSAIPYIVMNDLAKFEFVYNERTFANYIPVFKILIETIQANEFENEHLAEM